MKNTVGSVINETVNWDSRQLLMYVIAISNLTGTQLSHINFIVIHVAIIRYLIVSSE